MTRSGVRVAASAAALAVVLLGPRASADGGFFVETTESVSQEEAVEAGLVSSSGQRAVLWLLGGGCYDLYVDPGRVAVEGAAWVLPLPVVPVVSEASEGFLDELDAATAPLLLTRTTTVTTTYVSYWGCDDGGSSWGLGCGAMAADGAGGGTEESVDSSSESETSSPEVTVLGEGRLGPTSYEVVSATTPDALETWLGDNGYAVPDGIAEAVAGYVEQGWVFYVARVDRRPDDPTRLSTPRLTLCDASSVVYPLRLSGLSSGSPFVFTLWVVAEPGVGPVAPTDQLEPMGEFFEPYVESWDGPPTGLEDLEQAYWDRLVDITSWSLDRRLAVQLATTLDDWAVLARVEAAEGTDGPLSEIPSLWTEELQALTTGGRTVLRLYGALESHEMEPDIEVAETYEGQVATDSGVYVREVSVYYEDWIDSDGCPGEPEEEEEEPIFGSPSCAVSASGASRARGIAGLGLGLLLVSLCVRRLRRG